MRKIFASSLFVFVIALVMAQDSAPTDKSHDMSGMDMSGHDMSNMGGEEAARVLRSGLAMGADVGQRRTSIPLYPYTSKAAQGCFSDSA